MIVNYCREAGIRSLQKNTNKLMEKIAAKIIEETDQLLKANKKEKIEKIFVN